MRFGQSFIRNSHSQFSFLFTLCRIDKINYRCEWFRINHILSQKSTQIIVIFVIRLWILNCVIQGFLGCIMKQQRTIRKGSGIRKIGRSLSWICSHVWLCEIQIIIDCRWCCWFYCCGLCLFNLLDLCLFMFFMFFFASCLNFTYFK